MSIICGRRHDLINYPFEKVSYQIRTDLLEAAQNTIPFFSEDMVLVLIGFECYCQVYNQQIYNDVKQATSNRQVIEYYCALISDGHIFMRSKRGNALLATYFLKAAQMLHYMAKSNLTISTVHGLDPTAKLLKKVRSLPVNSRLFSFWRGWPSVGANGAKKYLPLQDIYRCCGDVFTQQLFHAMNDYYSNRSRGLHGTWVEMLSVLVTLGKRKQLNKLQDPRFSREFFSTILRRFLASAKTNGHPIKYASLAIEWRNHFNTFALEYLCTGGLVAFPYGGFPMPRGERVLGAHTNVRINKDGTAVKEKLLTDVPVQVTDRDAINILFNEIQCDIKIIRSWAEKVTNDIWQTVLMRKKRAKKGISLPLNAMEDKRFLQSKNTKVWLKSSENSLYLENMAATFERYRYLTSNDEALETIYADRYEAARDLGMPSIKVLMAYCTLLIINHPELTRSALQSLELFDKHGAIVGLRYSDCSCHLVSYKNRSRAQNAEKITLLNDQSQRLVEQLIEVTAPLREYLRNRGDATWRYLFLHSGRSFAYPKVLRGSEVPTRSELQREFKCDLANMGVANDVVDRLSKVFTLTRLRGSMGVAEYLRSTSVAQMAKVLGHKEYKKNLIDHYLPEPIRRFFEERWVRIFQAGIVCEAMKKSPFLLEASGFKSMLEVDEFLRNHMISFPDNIGSQVQFTKEGVGEIVFSINEDVLTLMNSIAQYGNQSLGQMSELAQYWSKIANKLIEFIKSDACKRPDIKEMLDKVSPSIDSKTVQHLML